MAAADKLVPVSSQTLVALRDCYGDIARIVVTRLLATPQVAAPGDPSERRLMAGVRFTTLALQTAIFLRNTDVLDAQLEWAADRLGHDGVAPEQLLALLLLYAEVVEQVLPPEPALVLNQYVQWMIRKQRQLMHSADLLENGAR